MLKGFVYFLIAVVVSVAGWFAYKYFQRRDEQDLTDVVEENIESIVGVINKAADKVKENLVARTVGEQNGKVVESN